MPFAIPRGSRIALGTSYAGLTTAGVWFASAPSALLQSTMGALVYGWAIFLLVGGTLCLVGILTRLWIGEFTGLVLLFFGNAAWACALVGVAFSPGASSTSAKYGLVLLSLSFAAFAVRWFQIREKVSTAAEGERHKRRRRRP